MSVLTPSISLLVALLTLKDLLKSKTKQKNRKEERLPHDKLNTTFPVCVKMCLTEAPNMSFRSWSWLLWLLFQLLYISLFSSRDHTCLKQLKNAAFKAAEHLVLKHLQPSPTLQTLAIPVIAKIPSHEHKSRDRKQRICKNKIHYYALTHKEKMKEKKERK